MIERMTASPLNRFDPFNIGFPHVKSMQTPSGWKAAVRRLLILVWAATLLPVNGAESSPRLPDEIRPALDRLMSGCFSNQQFNGVCLVARGDQVIFERAAGFRDLQNTPNTMQTAFELASVTKPITASAILFLIKEGRLTLTQDVARFFPNWPYSGVTVQHLLTHTAGLPDYRPLFASGWESSRVANNADLLRRLIEAKPPLQFPPGQGWSYSNTAYAILALVVGRVSGQAFDAFVQNHLFKPSGMASSGVWPRRVDDAAQGHWLTARGYKPWSVDRHLDGIVGDGGAYATAADLHRFAQAFFSSRLLGETLTRAALTPVRTGNGGFHYHGVGSGLGWYLKFEGDEPNPVEVFHTGNYGGFRLLFWHDLRQDWTLVLMDNFNHPLDEIGTAAQSILTGKSWQMPRRSIQDAFLLAMSKEGLEGALRAYQHLKTTRGDEYNFGERELNTLGYVLLRDNCVAEAIAVFRLNTEEHADSFNAFDSLAEAWVQKGDLPEAIRCYERAVALNPNFQSGRDMIERLRRQSAEGKSGGRP